MKNYYGTGVWLKVDDKGASSYLDKSTAVQYDSKEDMVKHANLMFKAWSPKEW